MSGGCIYRDEDVNAATSGILSYDRLKNLKFAYFAVPDFAVQVIIRIFAKMNNVTDHHKPQQSEPMRL